jgi:hypothetical protein
MQGREADHSPLSDTDAELYVHSPIYRHENELKEAQGWAALPCLDLPGLELFLSICYIITKPTTAGGTVACRPEW